MNDSLDHILWLTTPDDHIHENHLYSLADYFNTIVDSDRLLIPDFYDCGTNARAIFLALVALHRGDLILTEAELDRMKQQYNPTTRYTTKLTELIETLEEMNPGVVIISIRFWLGKEKQFGHVWIFEKLTDHSFNIYQSALNNYMVSDYYDKYGCTIDPFNMLNEIKPLLEIQKWNKKTQKLFTDIFKFTPLININTSVQPELLYTYIEY
jgi:hypothetical protein